MLTPVFELSQDDTFVIIYIQVPYAKISELEVHFEDTDFMFYSKPYYLRLNLPGKVLYSEEPVVDYDIDKRTVTIKAPKAHHGEIFEDLDLLTSLLVPKKGKNNSTPLIEIVDGTNGYEEEEEEDEFDWCIEQTPPDDELCSLSVIGQHCGFANSYSFSVFSLKEEASEIFDVKEPQNKSLKLRKEERLMMELKQFDEDHYLADLYHDEEIQQLLKYRPEWEDLHDELQSNSSIKPLNERSDFFQFTSEEKEKLQRLPNKEYLLDKLQMKMILLGLVDIIFAYAYNKRTTEGENTVESGWTINKTSATLSWLESFSSVQEVAVTCIRRSLCYPLFRHFELSLTVLDDVRKIFLLGRKYVIKCLLEIHGIFYSSEPRYILNDLYVTDYCIWMQNKRCSSRKLAPLADTLGKILLTKGDIGLHLVDLETFAEVAWRTYGISQNPVSSTQTKRECESTDKTYPIKQNTSETTDAVCSGLEKLALQRRESDSKVSDASSPNSRNANIELYSEYESCSSCTSDSSDSTSNTFETDSTAESNSEYSSSTDSDDDTESSTESDLDSHSQLLKKENGERLR